MVCEVGGEGLGRGGGGVGGSGRGGWSEDEWGDLAGDLAGSLGGFLVGEDGDGGVVVGEEDVFGDEAADFAGVLDDVAAVLGEDFDAETVVGVFAVGEGVGGLHVLVAGGGEEGLVHDGEVPLESWEAGMARSPSPKYQPGASRAAGEMGARA